MTTAAAIGAGAATGPGAGSGSRFGPEAGKAVSGLDAASAHAPAGENLATTSFRSSWQSLVASLNEEMQAGEAQKPTTEASGSASLPAKAAQQLSANGSESESAQAAIARFKLSQAALFVREAEADTSQAEAQDKDLESSESAGKSAHRASSASNSGSSSMPGSAEKKADKNLQHGQTAAQTAVAIAVPLPVAVPQPPSVQNTIAAEHAQSVLRDASLHNAAAAAGGIAPALPGEPANGILTPAARGISPGASAANTAWGAASGRAAHTDDSSAATGGTAQPGVAPPAGTAAHSDGNPVTNIDTNINANLDANADADSADSIAGIASASAGSLSGSHAAHALAAVEKRGAEPVSAQRLTSGAASAASLQGHLPGMQPGVQPIGQAGDSSAFSREGAAGRTVVTALPATAADKAPGSGETFAALDADAAHGASWLHAGAHSAEAGFEDPALGWVSVRADLAAGGVHAAVVPGTAEAAQALSTHMAGLNSFLNDQRTPVHTLTLSSPGGDLSQNQGAANQGTGNQGAGNQAGGQSPTYRDAAGQQPVPSIQTPARSLVQTAHIGGDAIPIAPRAGASISLIA